MGVPSIDETEFNNLEVQEPFTSNLTFTMEDFSNTFHLDRDANTYTFGIWAPIHKENGKLTTRNEGYNSEGGSFVVPNYGLYIDFNACDGIVEIIWRGGKIFG